jgi:hypothetical protein
VTKTAQTLPLFGLDALPATAILEDLHYLGRSLRGVTYRDDYGVMVFANPSSRRLPQVQWLELVRWCITSEKLNSGSQQWRAARRWLLNGFPAVTTIVSYSDPSAGHTGALYRACNWLWAPTWHRLRTPPTGNGSWDGKTPQQVKDRWIFPLRPDPERAELLAVKDDALRAKMPWAQFREGSGGDYRRWHRLLTEALKP